jgi:hypothetical protein
MRDLLRALRPGGTAAIGAAWGAEAYRYARVGRLRLVLFGVAAGALDGPNAAINEDGNLCKGGTYDGERID